MGCPEAQVCCGSAQELAHPLLHLAGVKGLLLLCSQAVVSNSKPDMNFTILFCPQLGAPIVPACSVCRRWASADYPGAPKGAGLYCLAELDTAFLNYLNILIPFKTCKLVTHTEMSMKKQSSCKSGSTKTRSKKARLSAYMSYSQCVYYE